MNGPHESPLYSYLKREAGFVGFGFGKKAEFMDKMLKKSDPMYASKPDIKWNFTKFLVDRKGKVIARFEPTADMKEVEEAVAKSLKD